MLYAITLHNNSEINNGTARKITGIDSENEIKKCFIALVRIRLF